jgi:hypothetical protein
VMAALKESPMSPSEEAELKALLGVGRRKGKS